jgi:hypothetical protein
MIKKFLKKNRETEKHNQRETVQRIKKQKKKMRNGTKKKKRYKKLKENEITKRHKRDIEEKMGGKRYLAQRREIVAICTERVDRFARRISFCNEMVDLDHFFFFSIYRRK